MKYCIIGHSFFQTKGMDTMSQLKIKDTFTSLELMEQINHFRKLEGTRAKLRHDTLLNIIRDEFEEEIGVQKILETYYKHPQNGQRYPMFVLTASQAKQVLVRESKFVRRAVIKYIEELESQLQVHREEIQLERKTYKGIPVLTTSDMSVLLGIPHGTVLWYCQKYQVKFIMLTGQTLQDYKKENKNREKFVSKLAVFTKSTVIKMLRCVNRYTKDIQKIIEAYFVESLPASQGMIEKSKCISLKHKKNAIDELRKQAKTIDGMLKMLPECKRTTEKHNASIEFVIEGVMSLLLDLQDLRRNMI